MGNFEKLSVLVIVVIIVMILVVALYTWQANPKETEPNKEEVAKTGFAPVPEEPWPDLFKEDKEADQDPPETDPVPPMPSTPDAADEPDGPEVPPTPVVTPPAAPAEEPAVPDDGPWTYTIKSGDTISQICERELGSWRRQKEVFALNPGLDPLTIREGDKLKMPPRGRASSLKVKPGTAAAVQAAGGKPTPGEWYVLRRGDRMSSIAKRAYGSIERWPELWARNLSVVKDPDDVQEGTRIFIPK